MAWSLLAMMTYWLLSSAKRGESLGKGLVVFLAQVGLDVVSDRLRGLVPDFVVREDLLGHLEGGIVADGRPGGDDRRVIHDAGLGHGDIGEDQRDKPARAFGVLAHPAALERIEVLAHGVDLVNRGGNGEQQFADILVVLQADPLDRERPSAKSRRRR